VGRERTEVVDGELFPLQAETNAETPEDLPILKGFSLRRIRLMDSLHAILQVRVRPFLLREDGGGENDVRDIGERVILPCVHDEELRSAEVLDDFRIARPSAEIRLGDVEEIDSIRTFDPDSQRSLYPVPEVRLLPGREFPMDDAARAKFRSRWRELLAGDPTKSRIYKDVGNGVATAGIEYYLPLFFEETATVFDYLGQDASRATVVLHGDLEPAFQRFWQDTKDRYRLVKDAVVAVTADQDVGIIAANESLTDLTEICIRCDDQIAARRRFE